MDDRAFVLTPLGMLAVTVDDAGRVCRVEFVTCASQAASRAGAPLTAGAGAASSGPASVVALQIEQYFSGLRRDFDVEFALDTLVRGPFTFAVLSALCEIQYGQTCTYGEVAASLGRPGAARAVGQACAANPIPIIIACHRVIAADGSLGGYRCGVDRKRALLALEH